MSGSKQHFIPQFILREFAHERSKGQFQVRVTRSDRNYLSPTQDVAAQKHFYSSPKDGNQLDEAITNEEPEFADIHRRLISSLKPNPSDAASLISHLEIRGSHIRQVLQRASLDTFTNISQVLNDREQVSRLLGINKAHPEGALRKSFDRKFNELKENGEFPKVSRHEFRQIFHREIRKNFPLLFPALSQEANKIIGLMKQTASPDFVANAHNEALTEQLVSPLKIKHYESLSWVRIVSGDVPFILPDCVAICENTSGQFSSSLICGIAELRNVFFPISSNVALIGCSGELQTLSTSELNQACASACWEFFISDPRHHPDSSLCNLIQISVMEQLTNLLSEALSSSITG